MGGSGSGYGKGGKLTKAELERRHKKEDSDAYLFDVEYEKLKKEQEAAEREYEEARQEYMRISKQLQDEMANGTASDADMARFMAVLTNRGVQLQQEQQKMSEQIDKLAANRADIENRMNELRKRAFSGATHAYESASREKNYEGFKMDDKQKTKVVEMTPAEYLRRVAFDVKGQSMESLLNSVSTSQVEKYARQMLRGIRFGAPSMNFRNGSSSGDERVWAALLNGYSRIPVMVVE